MPQRYTLGHSLNATMQREAYSECFAFFVERGSRRIPAKISATSIPLRFISVAGIRQMPAKAKK